MKEANGVEKSRKKTRIAPSTPSQYIFSALLGIMQAAVKKGDVKELAGLMRQDPGFNVNKVQDGDGWTLLHYACWDDSRSAVIPLLLAHPDIDVNVKSIYGSTPFFWACEYGQLSCVREMLKDSRVKVNEPHDDGYTPLWIAAYHGHLDVIKWWIASGREMDLGKAEDFKKDRKEKRKVRSCNPVGEIQE